MSRFMRQISRSRFHLFISGLVLLLAIVAEQPATLAIRPTWISKRVESLRQSGQRWIEVNLTTQRLVAWEGEQPVYAVIVSTGKDSSPTQTGVFAVQTRHRLTRMQGEGYDVPDVPYTMFYSGNYAIHGTYWHSRFGTPVSHGCINVAVDHARWLFHWSAIGTPVVVHK